jgi:hypothetical protein
LSTTFSSSVAYLTRDWKTASEAIQWVRQFLPYAIKTPEQQRLLLHDEEA